MPDPNVVVVTTHDSGRWFGCYGAETVRTPEIDSLAADGYRFSDFFTVTPQCSPSRAALLTGQYPGTNGVMGLASEPWGWTLSNPEHHLSARLRAAGYDTALFGLQHEAIEESDLAFDHRGAEGSADEVAESVASYVAGADEPFYAQVGLFETHRPLDYGGAEPDDERGVTVPPYIVDNGAAREEFAALQGALRAADRAVGQIRDGLADAGVEEDTVLAFTSDHGISFTRAKGYLYDAGLGVPLVVRWPGGGVEGGVTCDWLASSVDVVSTLLDLLDRPAPSTEGVSLAGAFDDPGGEGPRDAVYAGFHDHAQWGFGPHARCVRTRDHKLIRNFTPDRRFEPPIDIGDWSRTGRDGAKSGPRPTVELYDLADDPEEFENRAEEPAYADVRADLDDRLRAWLEAVDDPILEGPPASPYYRRAREGTEKD